MSLVDKLAGLAEDRSPDAILKAIDGAKELAQKHLRGPERVAAKKALDEIGKRSKALGHLGVGGLVSLVARFDLAGEDGARAAYLTKEASLDELVDASYSLTADTAQATTDRENAWAEVNVMLKSLGAMAIKLLPLLLMAA